MKGKQSTTCSRGLGDRQMDDSRGAAPDCREHQRGWVGRVWVEVSDNVIGDADTAMTIAEALNITMTSVELCSVSRQRFSVCMNGTPLPGSVRARYNFHLR
jgi:hypothetical protein